MEALEVQGVGVNTTLNASQLTITVSATVVLDGELDHATERMVNRRVARLAESADVIHIDTRQISFIDAAGVRTLLLAKQDALDHDATITVQFSSPGPVERILRLTGLTGGFDGPGANAVDHASGNGQPHE